MKHSLSAARQDCASARHFCSADNSVFGDGYAILERVLAASRRCRRIDEEQWVLNPLRSCAEGEPQ